jgi:hypothetical protein
MIEELFHGPKRPKNNPDGDDYEQDRRLMRQHGKVQRPTDRGRKK